MVTNQGKCRFEVETVVPYKDGFGLSGRCTAGPIKIGDVFVLVSKTEVEASQNNSIVPKNDKSNKINLVVHEIQYFNKSIAELQTQYAGGLYVLGVGAELLGQPCEIETA